MCMYVSVTLRNVAVTSRRNVASMMWIRTPSIVHMYSMPYYTYDSTANFLFLDPTALICIDQKNGAVMRIYVRGVGNFIIE